MCIFKQPSIPDVVAPKAPQLAELPPEAIDIGAGNKRRNKKNQLRNDLAAPGVAGNASIGAGTGLSIPST